MYVMDTVTAKVVRMSLKMNVVCMYVVLSYLHYVFAMSEFFKLIDKLITD